ncbi:MAG: SAM-dependent methyltransferase, partial [Verrucomicrobiaceae bacterium]
MGNHASGGTVAVVMFNLGYLPGADHSVATGDDTLPALEAAAGLIRGGGVLSVMCYPGHEGGGEEANRVETWMATLPAQGWRVAKYGALGTLKPAPYLLLAVLRAAAAS